MKIRFASKSTVVDRNHNNYLVVDAALGTVSLMAYNQMPRNLQDVTKEPARLAFAIEDTCLGFKHDTQNQKLIDTLLNLIDKYSPDELWVFHSKTPI